MNQATPNLRPEVALHLGRPRFGQEVLRQLAAAQGDESAWVQALSGDLTSTLAATEGEFAVAVHFPDGRSVMAVDRFATRSLCYRVEAGRLRVAARAEALSPEREIDPQAVFDYLYFHVIPSPSTVFRGVQRLPPGHVGVFENGRLEVRPYWTPRFEAPQRWSFADAKTRFRGLIEEAVRDQVGSGKPACFLSGGTDSSTVAGLLRQVTGQAPSCYSIGFEAEGYDEMVYARIAAQRFGVEHREHYVTPDELATAMPAVATHYDQPFGNSSAVPAFCCARVAAADGVTRLLAGDGGDELFGGNSRYATQRVLGWHDELPRLLRDGPLAALGRSELAGRIPLLGKGRSYVRQASVPMPDRMHAYNLLHRIGTENVVSPGLLSRVDVGSPARQQAAVWNALPQTDIVNRMLAYDWRFTLAENDLPKVVQTAWLAGTEVGFPLLDARLVDFSLGLPVHAKLRGLRLRWFFKEALRGFLPDEIITKKKHGFGLPFGVWLVKHAGLQSLTRDALQGLESRGIVRAGFAQDLFARWLPEHPGYYGEMAWILTMLELWLRANAPALDLRG